MEIFDIRNRMEELMDEKGISREELAKAMGCSRRIVSYWFSRQRAFNEDWLLNLCEALDVTPNEFFKVEQESRKAEQESRKAEQESLNAEQESMTDCFARLCQMDDDTIRRKLASIRKMELLLELVLQLRDTDFQEQWKELLGEESGSDA